MFDPCKGALPAIQQGKQKALALAATARLANLPEVPTFGEIGVPGYNLRIWTGILAPAGTPQAVIAKLNQAVRNILRTAEIRQEISQEGGEAGATSPRQFASFITSERARWRLLVQESGVSRVGIAEAP